MRKALLCIAVLLAFGLTAVAQDTGTSGQSSTTTTTTKKSTRTAASKGNTITGCIEKSGDNYMIKNGRYKNGVKVTGSDDLSPHVGHTVKLTGTWASAAASTGETKGGGMKMSNREFNETKVDMVSETCKMGAGKAASSSSDTTTTSTKTKKSKKSTATTPQ